MILVVLLLGWHFFLTYTWGTSSIALRELIGTNLLNSYMTPMFQQGWAVFAPNPGSTNSSLEVRALLPAAGADQPVATDWFSITGADTEQFVRNHAAPSRMYLNNYILGDRFHGAFLAMNPNVRELVGNDYYGEGWLDRLRADLTKQPDPWAANYLEYEGSVTGLATAIARARWGDDITAVQVRTVSTPAVPFDQRLQSPPVTEQPSYFIEGWRSPLDVPGLDTSAIADFYGTKK
ncbi:hypothetical protein B7R25_13420 [Subtercola boreus]|uniref:Uncharacterized protein n=1 Tax=Subtercola boreus TaxID=120213 RepID=A0A3E0W7X2_9MICO|nr:hypothetical protein B7R23_13310 [Subtercola boreus]RFA19103.1 hypothetical protein B7R24_13320 [Subtercola boreus]RFA25703.1 hypothetical protein B7R25_13420 [Subtercola boreus]